MKRRIEVFTHHNPGLLVINMEEYLESGWRLVEVVITSTDEYVAFLESPELA